MSVSEVIARRPGERDGAAAGARAEVPAWARSAAVRVAALAAGCLFLAALFASQIYLGMLTHGHAWWRLFAWQLGAWSLWGLAVPLVLALGRRLRLDRGPRIRNAAAHAGIAVGLTAIHVVPVTGLTQWIEPYWPMESEVGFVEQYWEMLPTWFPLGVLVYGGILGASYGWHYYHRYREREVAASQLEALLARAELEALKLQLQPHFLFNSLNAVSALVRRGEDRAAVKMLAGLSELLRYVLDSARRQWVSVEEEIGFAERYLEIHRQRFGDRLEVSVEAAAGVLGLRVPTLLLQPLVENALEHGVARRGRGRVRVEARRDGSWLELRVADDGAGLDGGEIELGVGLEATRGRLERHYGERFALAVRPLPEGGVESVVRLPLDGEPEPGPPPA